MDFYRNEDKWSCRNEGVSYNQFTQVTKAPVTVEPLTLSEVKEWCKVENSSDDAILTALITAAREICEAYTNCSFVQREISANINNLNGGSYLPYGPVSSITGVYDLDGNTITGYTVYNTSAGFAQIDKPKQPINIVYSGGYSELPESLKTALKAQVLYLFENRGDAQDAISPIALVILNHYKRV